MSASVLDGFFGSGSVKQNDGSKPAINRQSENRRKTSDEEFAERLEKIGSGSLRPSVSRETAPGAMLAEVHLEAHGLKFAVAPDRSRSAELAAEGVAVLSVGEVERLQQAGCAMPEASVRALHATKLAMPGLTVVSTKDLR